MWTYTAYILNMFGERNGYTEVQFKELSDFMFDKLWRGQHLVFHDGKEDLMCDLRYLDKLEIINLEENNDYDKTKIKIGNEDTLKKISKIVEDSALLTGVKLFDEYRLRIDKAFETV